MLYLKSKKLLLSICFFGLFLHNTFAAPAVGDFQSIASGNWSAISTWQQCFVAGSWAAATSTPTSASGFVTILTGNNVTFDVSISVDQLTINLGGTVTVNSLITMTVANGAGTDLTVAGTIINSGTITPTGTISFSAGGLYQHSFSSAAAATGTIPTAAWAVGSTCEILACGNSGSGPLGLAGQAMSDFSWNNTTQTVDINLAGVLVAQIGRDFYMKSTGGALKSLILKANVGGATAVGRDFLLSGGNLVVAGGTVAATGNNSLTISGAYTQTGGTCTLSTATGSAAANNGNGTVTVTGLTTISAGTLTFSTSPSNLNSAGGNGYFNANNAGVMAISGTAIVNLASSSGDGSGGGGTLTATGAITISGTAAVNLSTSTRTSGGGNGSVIAGGLLTLQAGTITGSTSNGNGSINANGGFTMIGGLVNLTPTILTSGGAGNGTFNVTGACAISAGTFNLNSSGVTTGTIGAAATLAISGALNVSGTALLNLNSSTSTGGGGSSTITVGALVTLSGGTINGNTSNAATVGCNVDLDASAGLTVSGGTFNVCSGTCTTGGSAGGGNTTVTVTGATTLSGTGIVNLATGGATGSGGNIGTIDANGTFTMNAGTPSLNLCSSSTTGGGVAGSGALNVTSTFIHTLASTTISKTAATNTGTINITGAAAQTIQSTNGFNIGNTITFNIAQNASTASILGGQLFLVNQGTTLNVNDNTSAAIELTVVGTLNNSGIINVNNNAILDMGATVMSNAIVATGGFFNLLGTSGLITKHAGGIALLGSATGCIQVTGGRSYSSDADYTYNGGVGVAQVTGNGLPTALTNNSTLTINNTSSVTTLGVTLTQSTTTLGALTLTAGRFISTLASLMTIGAGGTSSGGSIAAFVDGPIQKIGNTGFIFPTGDIYNAELAYPSAVVTVTAKWARIEIGAPTNLTDAFTAEYHKMPDPCNVSQVVSPTNGAGINHVSYKEYWELTRSSAAAVTPTVKLYWENGSSAAAPGTGSAISSLLPADLHVAECIASTWTNENSAVAATTGVAAGPGTIVTNSGTTTFTTGTIMPFTFSTPSGVSPLPIELLTFTGNSTVTGNQLNWATATETNNNYFDLERSSDANEFLKIATIAGAGNSTSIKGYDYLDNSPFNGINYYRLKQVDYNGAYTYSNVIAINNNNSQNASILVYPNPSNDEVNIVTSANITDITIYNMMGEIVYANSAELSNTIKFKPMAEGMYVVKALDINGKTSIARFVKK